MSEPISASQPVASDNRVGEHGPGLDFTVANVKGAPVVYITNDATLNSLTLTITNQTGAAVTLKHGTPVSEEQISAQGPTSLYLSFGDLLTTDQLKALVIDSPGWQRSCFVGAALKNWALTPVNDIVIPDGGTFTVTITHLTVSGQPRPGALTVDYFNVPGLHDDSVQRVLAVQAPPSQPHDLVLNAEIVGSNVVYVSNDAANPILNTLVLSIANSSPDTPIVPGNVPLGQDPPIFFLSFAYGKADGYGALTTIDLSKTIQVDPMDHTTDTWKPERVDAETGSYWRLKPQQHEVLGIGAAGRVGFTISHIITEFKPESLPTQLYLQWAHIPGYNDSHLSLAIVKALPTPGILAFRSLTPEVVAAGESVSLTWQTFGVARVHLSYKVGEQAVVLDSAAGQIGLNAQSFVPTPAPMIDTVYSLDAFDGSGSKVDSWQVVVAVTHPPISIDSFTASPPAANFSIRPVDVTLTWSVTPAGMIKSLEIEAWASVIGQTSYVVRGVTRPATYALRATGLGGDVRVALVRLQALDEYLVGRACRFLDESWDYPDHLESGTYFWKETRAEILSSTEALCSIDAGAVPVTTTAGGYPHPPRGPSRPGYPKHERLPWRLVGQMVEIVTSEGTMSPNFRAFNTTGEA